MKILQKLKCWLTQKNIRDCWKEDFYPYKFIWGILSADDLSNENEANFYTMNDFEILYNTETKKYCLSIETIYYFSQGKEGECLYLQNLMKKFTLWMKNHNYNINYEVSLYEVFTCFIGEGIQSNTIEELYAKFKMIVDSYCAIYNS